MATKAHFENIKEKIIEQLYSSTKSIKVAVAWFTDADLFEILCKKAKSGLRIELLLANDDINHNCSIDYNKLTSCGGKIYFVGEGTDFEPIMHHKFCIIDNYTLIFGSYNWTNKAKSNHENITIIDNDANIILDYNDEFEKLRYYHSTKKEIQLGSKVVKLIQKSIDELYEENWILYSVNKNEIRLVKKNDKVGLFDMKTQNEILDCQFQHISIIKDNYVLVISKDESFLFDFIKKKKIELLSSEFKAEARTQYGRNVDTKWKSDLVLIRDVYSNSDENERYKFIGRFFITECYIQNEPNVNSYDCIRQGVVEKNGKFYAIISPNDLYEDYLNGDESNGEFEVNRMRHDEDREEEIIVIHCNILRDYVIFAEDEEQYVNYYCKGVSQLHWSNNLTNPFFEI